MFPFGGAQTFVVGLDENGEDGCLKVYVGHRAKGTYVLIENEADKDEIRRAWSHQGHVLIPLPSADQIYVMTKFCETKACQDCPAWTRPYQLKTVPCDCECHNA